MIFFLCFGLESSPGYSSIHYIFFTKISEYTLYISVTATFINLIVHSPAIETLHKMTVTNFDFINAIIIIFIFRNVR